MPEANKFKQITQSEIIMEYFISHENEEVPHSDIVPWAMEIYEHRTGRKFRDPDRQIRTLHQQGVLQKIKKGVYLYNSAFQGVDKTLNDFTTAQRVEILNRGEHKCAICGLGRDDGVELHADHIIPKENGGTNNIDNGQVLCSRHNFLKKTYNQSETGKRFFLNLKETLYNTDLESENLKMFVEEVLEVYDKYNVNGHIQVKKNKVYSKVKK